MKVLGIDTSSVTAACAVAEDGKIVGEVFCNAGLTHSQTSMEMVEFVLHQTGISMEEIQLYAVTTGPGSFTGLRIGLSQVKGMAMPGAVPCVGISTLEALAWNEPLWKGLLVPCLDARRQQVYTGIFQWNKQGLQRWSEDEAMPLELLMQRLQQENLPVMFLGDGAKIAYEYALSQSEKISCILAPEKSRYVKGSSVIQCGMKKYLQGKSVAAEQLEPHYLRLPQVYQ